MKWREAKTYAKSAPHQYITRWDDPVFFDRTRGFIEKYGVYEDFTLHGKTNRYKYYYRGNYRYWIIWPVLNRCPKTQPHARGN